MKFILQNPDSTLLKKNLHENGGQGIWSFKKNHLYRAESVSFLD